jgi:excisionase family DNA binding protein
MTDTTKPRPAHTVKETLQILPLGRSTIYKLVATGELRSVKVGKKILIPESAIFDFLERQPLAGSPAQQVA